VSSQNKKVKEGVVVSNKMQKTVTVRVERIIMHPQYRKVIKQSRKYYAHNEDKDIQVGQRVLIEETRPISKLKRWIVKEVMAS